MRPTTECIVAGSADDDLRTFFEAQVDDLPIEDLETVERYAAAARAACGVAA